MLTLKVILSGIICANVSTMLIHLGSVALPPPEQLTGDQNFFRGKIKEVCYDAILFESYSKTLRPLLD